jgi:hypothetical protein
LQRLKQTASIHSGASHVHVHATRHTQPHTHTHTYTGLLYLLPRNARCSSRLKKNTGWAALEGAEAGELPQLSRRVNVLASTQFYHLGDRASEREREREREGEKENGGKQVGRGRKRERKNKQHGERERERERAGGWVRRAYIEREKEGSVRVHVGAVKSGRVRE